MNNIDQLNKEEVVSEESTAPNLTKLLIDQGLKLDEGDVSVETVKDPEIGVKLLKFLKEIVSKSLTEEHIYGKDCVDVLEIISKSNPQLKYVDVCAKNG